MPLLEEGAVKKLTGTHRMDMEEIAPQGLYLSGLRSKRIQVTKSYFRENEVFSILD